MAAVVACTGPAHLYLVTNTGVSSYIGTCETSPQIQFQPRTLEVKNDLAGRTLPFQRTADGEDAVVSCIFTRFDEAVVNNIANYQRLATGGSVGTESRLNRGSLVIGYSTFQLIIQDSFYGTTAFGATTLPGWRFYAAHVAGYVPSPIGTEARKVGLVFQCDNVFDASNFSFKLYDNATNISSFVPN